MMFVPPNRDGVAVTLYANFDWSFTLECGRFSLFDEEPMIDDDDDAHVALIVGEIESLARSGIVRSSFDRLIDLGRDRVAPWRRITRSCSARNRVVGTAESRYVLTM